MSVRKRLTLEQFGVVVRNLPKKLQRKIARGMEQAAIRGVGLVIEEIDRARPFPAVDQGELRQSVQMRKLSNGSYLFVDAPHAAIIEYGTRPFRPPLRVILAWVKRKHMVTTESRRGAEAEAKRIAWAICNKIAREGIAPRHYFKKAMARLPPIIDEEVRKELNREEAA